MTIRPFQAPDLATVLAIERASFRAEAWPAGLFREYAKSCPDLFLVAVEKDAVAGYSVTCVRRGRAELDSIAVLPRDRGKGVARALLGRTAELARGAGVTTIALTVRSTNATAIRLYETLGFRRVRTVYRYYEDGGNGYRMVVSI